MPIANELKIVIEYGRGGRKERGDGTGVSFSRFAVHFFFHAERVQYNLFNNAKISLLAGVCNLNSNEHFNKIISYKSQKKKYNVSVYKSVECSGRRHRIQRMILEYFIAKFNACGDSTWIIFTYIICVSARK